MARDLDLEVGGGVAVDVALDDGEFAAGAGLVGHRELPRAVKAAPVTSVKLWLPAVAVVGVDAAEVDPVARLEAEMVSPLAAAAELNLKVSLPARRSSR